MGEFTHFDSSGSAVMVDVSDKEITERTAVAKGRIRVSEEVFRKIREGTMKRETFWALREPRESWQPSGRLS